MTLSTGGFRQVVAFPPAPIATGWSDPCREGLAPSQEPCLSTAHNFITTTSGSRLSVHTTADRLRQLTQHVDDLRNLCPNFEERQAASAAKMEAAARLKRFLARAQEGGFELKPDASA
jgi:hypothetical protein